MKNISGLTAERGRLKKNIDIAPVDGAVRHTEEAAHED